MVYIVVQYVIVGARGAGIVQAKLDSVSFAYHCWLAFLIVHISASSIAFVIGPIQFVGLQPKKPASLHRALGYLYAVSIIIGSLTGAYLAYNSTGGPIEGLGFLMLDILWISTLSVAMKHVYSKRFIRHREWMLRSYSVTFAFVTFRVLLLPLTYGLSLNLQTGMQISSWLCWIINLSAAEWIIRSNRRKANGNKIPNFV
ncbi:DUF2306 domain-containing protein [Paenibacillus taihuensis]